MKTLQEAIRIVLTEPSPQALVALQGMLLAYEAEGVPVGPVLDLAGHFFGYLSDLQSKLTARQYSELASRLDIGAVGTVALDNILFAGENVWPSLLLGALGEGLMVAASRQYIKGWEAELGAVHARAAWHLAEALWRFSTDTQPALDPQERRRAVQALLAPAHDERTPASTKSLLLGYLYQALLAAHLIRLASE